MKIDSKKKVTAKERKELAELNSREISKMVSSAYRHEYEETGNPLFLMEAHRFHRGRKESVPEWIMKYFDSVTDGLLKEAENRIKGKKGQRDAFLINPTTQFNKYLS